MKYLCVFLMHITSWCALHVCISSFRLYFVHPYLSMYILNCFPICTLACMSLFFSYVSTLFFSMRFSVHNVFAYKHWQFFKCKFHIFAHILCPLSVILSYVCMLLGMPLLFLLHIYLHMLLST